MYEFAPKEEISLRDFEDIAAQRLKALRVWPLLLLKRTSFIFQKIEELKLREKSYDEFKVSMGKELHPIFKPCTLHQSGVLEDQRVCLPYSLL